MTNSPSLRFFSLNRERKTVTNTSLSPTPLGKTVTTANANKQANVHGWLMNVPRFHGKNKSTSPIKSSGTEHDSAQPMFMEGDSSGSPVAIPCSARRERTESTSSIHSCDSVNLDELIKKNFTVQVGDETDLPDLGDLDLDDSRDDFWKLDDVHPIFRTPITNEKMAPKQLQPEEQSKWIDDLLVNNDSGRFLHSDTRGENDPEIYGWSPKSAAADDRLETFSNPSLTSSGTAQSRSFTSSTLSSRNSLALSEHGQFYDRSGSFSSENSTVSQPTVTDMHQYTRYGMTPMAHPSESTSNSSRSHSRLSDYSANSQASSTTSGIPRSRGGSAASSGLIPPGTLHNNGRLAETEMHSSSRISAPRSRTTQSRLAKRATHVPMSPSKPLPSPQKASASRSTGLSTSASGNRAERRPSHLPSPRGAVSPEPRSGGRSPISSPKLAYTSAPPRSPLHTTLSPNKHNAAAKKRQSVSGAVPELPRRNCDPTGLNNTRLPSKLRLPNSTAPSSKEASGRISRATKSLSNGSNRFSGIRSPASFSRKGESYDTLS